MISIFLHKKNQKIATWEQTKNHSHHKLYTPQNSVFSWTILWEIIYQSNILWMKLHENAFTAIFPEKPSRTFFGFQEQTNSYEHVWPFQMGIKALTRYNLFPNTRKKGELIIISHYDWALITLIDQSNPTALVSSVITWEILSTFLILPVKPLISMWTLVRLSMLIGWSSWAGGSHRGTRSFICWIKGHRIVIHV